MPPKRSAALLAELRETLEDAPTVKATFRISGVPEPFIVRGRFKRIENAYGRRRHGVRVGVDSWHVVLSDLQSFIYPRHYQQNSWLPAETGDGMYPAPNDYIRTTVEKGLTSRELWLPINAWKFAVEEDAGAEEAAGAAEEAVAVGAAAAGVV
jgi:hypothetical protein